jgi:hypothetical protein
MTTVLGLSQVFGQQNLDSDVSTGRSGRKFDVLIMIPPFRMIVE